MRKAIFKNIHSTVKENLFKDVKETIWVYLKASNTKAGSYDPYRNTGYTQTKQTPFPVSAMVRQLTAESLIMRELGMVETGAIEIVIEEKDVNLFKFCEKVQYKEKAYAIYHQALGNRIQITNTIYGFSKIILFRTGN